jgi:hypothetical protein
MKQAIALLIPALLLAVGCSGAMADWSWKGWKGHHTKLFDARNACKNTDSLECEPFLAAAVAVADVFSEIAKPDEKGDLIVAFPDAVQERCSANFRQRMNGQTLLYSALAHPVGSDSAENIYWISALMRASRQLCHSENPVLMGRQMAANDALTKTRRCGRCRTLIFRNSSGSSAMFAAIRGALSKPREGFASPNAFWPSRNSIR